jgi:hypothetical protein
VKPAVSCNSFSALRHSALSSWPKGSAVSGFRNSLTADDSNLADKIQDKESYLFNSWIPHCYLEKSRMLATIFSGLLCKSFVGVRLSVMEIRPTPRHVDIILWILSPIRVISVIRGQTSVAAEPLWAIRNSFLSPARIELAFKV